MVAVRASAWVTVSTKSSLVRTDVSRSVEGIVDAYNTVWSKIAARRKKLIVIVAAVVHVATLPSPLHPHVTNKDSCLVNLVMPNVIKKMTTPAKLYATTSAKPTISASTRTNKKKSAQATVCVDVVGS